MSARPQHVASSRPDRRRRRAVGAWCAGLMCAVIAVVGASGAAAQTPPPVTLPPVTTAPPSTAATSSTTGTTAAASGGPATTVPATTTTAPGGTPPVPKVQKQPVADPVFDQGVVVDRFNALIEQTMAAMGAGDQRIAAAQQEVAAADANVSVAKSDRQAADRAVKGWKEGVASVAVGNYVAGPGGDLANDLNGNPQSIYRQVSLSEVLRGLKAAEDAQSAKQHALDQAQQARQKADDDVAAATKAKADATQKIADLERQAAQAETLLTQLALGDKALTPEQAAALLAKAMRSRGLTTFGPAPPVDPRNQLAVQHALAQMGKPYQWGGNGPNSFDCSGLTQQSYLRAGIVIPRVASDQQAAVVPISLADAQPGDLVFFGLPATHVGMYLGNGNMVDAPYTGSEVRIEPIYRSSLSGIGRVVYPN